MKIDGNGDSSDKKEKIIMLASSVLVLTALTMTGIYMKLDNTKAQDDGYMLDFTAMEDNTVKKAEEIARASLEREWAEAKEADIILGYTTEDDLDYMPAETENLKPGGRTAAQSFGSSTGKGNKFSASNTAGAGSRSENVQAAPEDAATAVMAGNAEAQFASEMQEAPKPLPEVLHFAPADGLMRPLDGEVLIPYSMDGSVYFSTLDQYKYNPAVMLVAEAGMKISSCATGTITAVNSDAEIGRYMTVDLGDGYELTYGQMGDIFYSVGDTVNAGDLIGTVGVPTKYFALEGANLYLKLTKDGVPSDPEILFR